MENVAVIEQLRCPICLEIPPGDIFQCKSGHTICASCQSPLEECPICRELYGPEKIRNRQMEFMLDMMTFPCLNVDSGCGKLLQRKDILRHYKHCQFSVKSIKSINICQMVGFNCPYQYEGTDEASLEAHLRIEHGARVHSGSEVLLLQKHHETQAMFSNFVQDLMWNPVILHSSERRFLILSYVDGITKTVSWIPLMLSPDAENDEVIYHAEFSIIVSSKDRTKQIHWKQGCIKYSDMEQVLQAKQVEGSLDLTSAIGKYIHKSRKGRGNYICVRVSIQNDSEMHLSSSPSGVGKVKQIPTYCTPLEFYLDSRNGIF